MHTMHVKYLAQYLDIKIAECYYFSKLYDCWYHLCSNVLHLGLNIERDSTQARLDGEWESYSLRPTGEEKMNPSLIGQPTTYRTNLLQLSAVFILSSAHIHFISQIQRYCTNPNS